MSMLASPTVAFLNSSAHCSIERLEIRSRSDELEKNFLPEHGDRRKLRMVWQGMPCTERSLETFVRLVNMLILRRNLDLLNGSSAKTFSYAVPPLLAFSSRLPPSLPLSLSPSLPLLLSSLLLSHIFLATASQTWKGRNHHPTPSETEIGPLRLEPIKQGNNLSCRRWRQSSRRSARR
eukprot:761273-Hanusia_phi.AAC.2